MKNIYYMQEALREAATAQKYGEVPVGAIVVEEGKIVARGYNQKEMLKDPTAHAEIIAIREAARELGRWRLNAADIYVTVEPCPMCLGAILQARMQRVIFGAPDPKSGAAGSVVDLAECKGLNHKVQVIGGILEEECRELITVFFRNKR